MNWAILGTVLGCITALITIIGVVVKLSSNYTKLKNDCVHNEQRLSEKVEELKMNQSIQFTQCKSISEQYRAEIKHELYDNVNSIKVDYEKNDTDIRHDFDTKVKQLEDSYNEDRIEQKARLEKLFDAQQATADTLKEISITMKQIEQNFDQRLSSLENKIDKITTIKLKDDI